MKTVCKKLLSLMLVAVLLVSAVPFQASAAEVTDTPAAETTTTPTETTAAPAEPVALASVEEETTAPETTAATEAPAGTVTENVAQQPAVASVGDTINVRFTLQEYPEANIHTAQNIKIGYKVGIVPSSYQVLSAYAQYGQGTYAGKQFSHWILSDGSTFDPYNYNVTDQMVAGNMVGNELLIYAVVTGQSTCKVWFERYDLQNGWVGVENYEVPVNSVINTDKGFPTNEEIAQTYALSGYSIVGWEIGETDTAFYAGISQITKDIVVRPRYQRTVTLEARNPVTQVSWSTKTITVEIGEPFGAIVGTLPNPGARDKYTFYGWEVGENVITAANLSNSTVQPLYYPVLGSTFYARWTESRTVYLYFHVDGNTSSAAKIVPYYQAPSKGVFDLLQINIYSIFPEYRDYDDYASGDVAYGWYTPTQWERYCTGKSADAATSYVDIGSNPEYGEFHIMLINGGGSSTSSYNNNSATADSSNPTTGDQIFMAVTVMAISATALALVFFLNKKRKAC